MLIKLCGIKTKNNLLDLPKIDIDMSGINFYEDSPRYVEDSMRNTHLFSELPNRFKKVGVFVNSDLDEIEWRVASFELDYIQLHGDEDLAFCQACQQIAKVIKVFRVDEKFDFNTCKPFDSCSSYFLFDTKVANYGGSGTAFDWNLLKHYDGQKGYFLSGGIGPDDAEAIKAIKDPRLKGIDINSKFEFAKANKDMSLVYQFVNEIKHND